MANAVPFPGDIVVPGSITGRGAVNLTAAANITPAAMQHEHRAVFNQPNTTATSETKVIATIVGATGTLKSFRAGSIVAALTTATVTVDLKKNGASVLSAPITLDLANTARVAEAGTISGATLSAGDVLEVVTVATASGGTLPTGLFAETRWIEDYSG
jgi:hypothetical protein